MCNLSTDFLQTCRGSTNIVIHRRLTKIIDNRYVWLECEFFIRLAKNFIFSMPTNILVNGFLRLEMLSEYVVMVSCRVEGVIAYIP